MFHRILVLAPHTDDGEFGCGGTIARMVEEGKEVYYAAFSAAEKSVPPEWEKDILRREVKEATAVLGIKPQCLIIENFPVRDFPALRQDILEKMIQLRMEIKPDLVFLPSVYDLHQDHLTIAREGIRAFKNISILGYEIPWNNLTFSTNCFIALDKSHVQKKVAALKCYASQSFRPYASEDFIWSLARTRGTQINAVYAEVFDTVRLYIK
ncbi:PIG-L deacetylase family protein [Desulfoscipio geothermicus]|uniref:N-acetylglucosaminyl deacetylase, LmbE family n=1 Tax=Desulfoscipio geothermicus DSM 3669 TaxID=1121426 RepID=A0A1I6E2Y9_9FIRM|nr:PIG-L deacetylase family protein [Desulfoscipio geothermicus]SFR12109.1 N-acetylglucosaminyl deacetylase, LmbE family [Desulfoscipio geothermicus DSM 3669]